MEAHQLNVLFAVVGGLLLILGLTSGALKRVWLSEPLVAMLAGIALGPFGLRVLEVANWDQLPVLMEQVSRFTLAIALMEVALHLPDRYLFRKWKSVAVLWGLLMPLMWLASAALIWLILGLPVLIALLIGAMLAPTDPIVASSIVSGSEAERYIPFRIRHLMSAESGGNDGVAWLFVMLPLLLMALPPGEALAQWGLVTLIWQVGGAVVIGGALGVFAGRVVYWARDHLSAERPSLHSVGLALSVATMGLVGLLGASDVLAVFAAGIGFNAVIVGKLNEEKAHIQEVVKRFFELPVFVLFGMVLPWEEWSTLGWGGFVLVVAIIVLRRVPAMLLIRRLIPELRSVWDALFLGWFGPVGIAAVLYASFAVERIETPTVWIVTSAVIFASVLVHGLTATPFSQWYAELIGEQEAIPADSMEY